MYDRRSQQRQPRCKRCQASGSPVLGDWPCAQAERLNAGSAPAQCRTDQSVVDRSHISNTVSSSQHIPNCCVGPTPRDHEELGGPSVPWNVGLDLRVRRSLWERVPASRPACSAGLPSWAWTPTSHAAEPARMNRCQDVSLRPFSEPTRLRGTGSLSPAPGPRACWQERPVS